MGHGARARARLATGGSPVDSPSGEPSGAEICLARPSRKRPAGRKNTVLRCYIALSLKSPEIRTSSRHFFFEPVLRADPHDTEADVFQFGMKT